MPHSVSPAAGEGSALPAAPPMEEEPTTATNSNQLAEEDVVMADADGAEIKVEAAEPSISATADQQEVEEAKEQKKPEIKIEDLFADADSDDDEFPASSNPIKGETPEPPSSQGYFLPSDARIKGVSHANRPPVMSIPGPATPSLCAFTTNAFSPGDTCFSGSTTALLLPTISSTASSVCGQATWCSDTSHTQPLTCQPSRTSPITASVDL